ncbi:MAG: transposase [Flavobacteriales bacterium]
MKNSKFTESKIVSILKLQDAGMSVSEICRQHGIRQPTFFN